MGFILLLAQYPNSSVVTLDVSSHWLENCALRRGDKAVSVDCFECTGT
jgi:hypothetical protein